MPAYISLQNATSLCPYSQEYLSLRARQGKLKALKLGRNWFTTKDWLDEYVASAEEYKKRMSEDRFQTTRSLSSNNRFPTAEPPRHLPIYAPDADQWEDDRPEELALQIAFQRKLQFAFAYAMVVGLLLASVMTSEVQNSAFLAGAGSIGQEYVSWLRTLW